MTSSAKSFRSWPVMTECKIGRSSILISNWQYERGKKEIELENCIVSSVLRIIFIKFNQWLLLIDVEIFRILFLSPQSPYSFCVSDIPLLRIFFEIFIAKLDIFVEPIRILQFLECFLDSVPSNRLISVRFVVFTTKRKKNKKKINLCLFLHLKRIKLTNGNHHHLSKPKH